MRCSQKWGLLGFGHILRSEAKHAHKCCLLIFFHSSHLFLSICFVIKFNSNLSEQKTDYGFTTPNLQHLTHQDPKL